ncbi:MAG: serine hydrolase domain-containing protein, partial [Planctomycetota bacterium]
MRRDHRGMPYRITLALLVVTSLAAAGTQELEDYCSRAEKFGFSGAVLVAKDGKILLQKGYGYANRAQQVANTERTLFEIASATKPFTAAAILKLEEQGKLSTDDPIGKHLPGVPAGLQRVTVYHLLTHTSGMP